MISKTSESFEVAQFKKPLLKHSLTNTLSSTLVGGGVHARRRHKPDLPVSRGSIVDDLRLSLLLLLSLPSACVRWTRARAHDSRLAYSSSANAGTVSFTSAALRSASPSANGCPSVSLRSGGSRWWAYSGLVGPIRADLKPTTRVCEFFSPI